MEKRLQHQVKATLMQFGLAIKLQTDTSLCPKCRYPFYPHHSGLSDYMVVREPSGRAAFVEVKAGDRSFRLDRLSTKQTHFLRAALAAFGEAYVWLFVSPAPRQTRAYLFPFAALADLPATARLVCETARTRGGISLAGYAAYELERRKGGLWAPRAGHPIYEGARVTYDTFGGEQSRTWFLIGRADAERAGGDGGVGGDPAGGGG